jgi:hypothetical protein
METEERRDEEPREANRDEEAAAKPGIRKQEPTQDETKDSTFDTDEHSDAPGPFGTG